MCFDQANLNYSVLECLTESDSLRCRGRQVVVFRCISYCKRPLDSVLGQSFMNTFQSRFYTIIGRTRRQSLGVQPAWQTYDYIQYILYKCKNRKYCLSEVMEALHYAYLRNMFEVFVVSCSHNLWVWLNCHCDDRVVQCWIADIKVAPNISVLHFSTEVLQFFPTQHCAINLTSDTKWGSMSHFHQPKSALIQDGRCLHAPRNVSCSTLVAFSCVRS